MNWKTLIAELQQRGMTQAEIGEACGTSQSTISSLIVRGGEPAYSLGAKLRELHKKQMRSANKDRQAA